MALAGTMILSLAATATAETGTFRMTQVELHDYTSFDFAGQTITGGALEGTGTVLDSSGGPFVAGEHSRVTCMVYAKRSGTGARGTVRHDLLRRRQAVHAVEA